jgi:hypothetical protein
MKSSMLIGILGALIIPTAQGDAACLVGKGIV